MRLAAPSEFFVYIATFTKSVQSDASAISSYSNFERAALAKCPCASPTLCLPVDFRGASRRDANALEVFVFAPVQESESWMYYDWNLVTTIAFNKNKKLLCYAHERNVKIVIKNDFEDMDKICDVDARQAWTRRVYIEIVGNYADGINLDLEKALDGEKAKCYTMLVQELRQELQKSVYTENAQITVDVPWSPRGVDDRYYDYVGLAAASDFLFVMSYDLRSQIYYECLAGANTPYDLVKKGLEEYIKGLQISPSKLVLGMAWYVYDYPCKLYTEMHDLCVIEEVSFVGAPCSDAGGSQMTYADMTDRLHSASFNYTKHWNPITKTPYILYENSKTLSGKGQLIFDDPKSLRIKYALVKALGLKGSGMWRADSLDYINDHKRSMEIWATLKP